MALRSVFDGIYGKGHWTAPHRQNETSNGGSGPGSTIAFTADLRALLSDLILELNVSSMLDIPCGGMVWQEVLLRQLGLAKRSLHYQGVDIVPSLIARHRHRYADWTNVSFDVLDMTNSSVPRGHDLLFSRDALQHLRLEQAVATLRHWASSDAKWLLVGSYPDARTNKQLSLRAQAVGKSFDIDLRKRPFCLEPTHDYLETRKLSTPTDRHQKHLYLYEMRHLRSRVEFTRMMREAMEFQLHRGSQLCGASPRRG